MQCGGVVDGGGDGVQCGACFRVQYCGAACQRAHWRAHRDACAEAAAARVHAGEGELEGADATLKRATTKAAKEFGEESAEALGCMTTYAEFLRKVARFDEAGALFRKMLEVTRRTLGGSHPDTWPPSASWRAC